MSVKGGNAVSENLTSGREQEWTLHAHVVSKGADEVISQVCALERQEFPENNSESELLRDLRRFKRCLLLICSRPDVGLAGRRFSVLTPMYACRRMLNSSPPTTSPLSSSDVYCVCRVFIVRASLVWLLWIRASY
ncbi:hypothetical protein CYMTET_45767 [Cymbomonas tetramitiformis]|uniref:Uncharacterized protein n=1 Tax=Cymbomonas tetramitiformis TaxID=36881 RepID=A0AAE0EXZ8_9CHLO|nr:hypothetical protein CYMTET_45767 [Cymbomonas tetramitiformis]